MSRTSYQQPDLPLSPKKSGIILAKKTALVGEVVNGGPLPNPPQHIPVCSFDSQNKYRGEVLVAEASTGQIKGTVCLWMLSPIIFTLILQNSQKLTLPHDIGVSEMYLFCQ